MSTFQGSLCAGVAAFALAIGSACIASPALAQSNITLPSASLEDSLNALSRRSGAQILVDQTLLRGKKARAIRGASSTEAALVQLLRGSGLTYQKRGNAFLIVRGRPAPAPRNDSSRIEDNAAVPVVSQAAAVEEAGGSDAGEQIVVTGSRIARPELESVMPVSVTKMEEALTLGRISAYDALARDPALGIGQNLSSAANGLDAGISAVNLRNLGTNRSLTLIDGTRRVSASARTSAVDIGMIPVGMIDRIEVVTGGAAAIYGADAVTGAVNIITKRDIDGFNVSATSGISQEGDASEFLVSLSTGGRFADGRGSFAIGGTWTKTAPLYYTDRFPASTNLALANNPANTGVDDGIVDRVQLYHSMQIYYAYEPTYFLNGKSWIIENGVPREARCGLTATTGEFAVCEDADGKDMDGRNLSDQDQLRGENEALALMGRTEYELTDAIRYGGYFSYSRQQYGGRSVLHRDDSRTAQFNGRGGSVAYLDNPFLPDAVRQVMLDNRLTSLRISRTYANFPHHRSDHDRESFTIGQSLGGPLSGKLDWQAFWQYGRTEDDYTDANVPWLSHWLAARDPIADPVTGDPICRNEAARAQGCVPFDIFSQERPSDEVLAYAMADRHERRVNSQEIYGASISGGLFSLPYGDLGIAVGVERRTEKLKTQDDPLALSGELVFNASNTTAHPELDVSSDVTEAYGEIVVPVLSDLPLAKRLEVEGAYRYSDYSTVGGTDTWKAGVRWSPFAGVTFRGVRSRSVRTPNFGELYEPQTISPTGSIDDPCEAAVYYATPTRAANCAALGITTPLGDNKVGPDVVTGGNVDLEPETSNSLTLGVVLQPKFLPGLDLTLDYWDIDIKNVITQFSYVRLLYLCVDLPTIDNPYCAQSVRDPVTHGPTRVASTQINAARLYARGVDLGFNYRQPLGSGQLNLSFKGSYLLKNVTETSPGIAAGDVIADGGWQNPRFRATLLTAYQIGNFNIALDTRFISAARYDAMATSPEAYPDNTTPPQVFNDLSIQYDASDRYRIGFGVRNISDVRPPFMGGVGIYTNNTVYDVIGRYFFVTTNLKF